MDFLKLIETLKQIQNKMNNKKQIQNLIILDESGSMQEIKEPIMKSFNEIIQTIKAADLKYEDQEHFVTFITFNSGETKFLNYMKPAAEVSEISAENYYPSQGTPLYDAMGIGITRLRKDIAGTENVKVLVSILTDGVENASTEYSQKAIKKLIEELKLEGWTFTYTGTDHNVEEVAFSLNITNVMAFKKGARSAAKMAKVQSRAMGNFFAEMNETSSIISHDFFKLTEEDKKELNE